VPTPRGTAAPKSARRKTIWLAAGAIAALLLIGGLAFWLIGGGNSAKQAAGLKATDNSIIEPPEAFQAQLVPLDGQQKPGGESSPIGALSRIPATVKSLRGSLQNLAEGAAPAATLIPPGQRNAYAGNAAAHQRWEIQFAQGINVETYARQLDFFGIELGVLGGADEVLYLSKLSQQQPDQRTGPASEDDRLYMTWQRGTLRDADLQLLARAEVAAGGKVLALFYPREVEQKLAQLEIEHAEEHKADQIRKTVFGIRPDGDDFEFYVLEQHGKAVER